MLLTCQALASEIKRAMPPSMPPMSKGKLSPAKACRVRHRKKIKNIKI